MPLAVLYGFRAHAEASHSVIYPKSAMRECAPTNRSSRHPKVSQGIGWRTVPGTCNWESSDEVSGLAQEQQQNIGISIYPDIY